MKITKIALLVMGLNVGVAYAAAPEAASTAPERLEATSVDVSKCLGDCPPQGVSRPRTFRADPVKYTNDVLDNTKPFVEQDSGTAI